MGNPWFEINTGYQHTSFWPIVKHAAYCRKWETRSGAVKALEMAQRARQQELYSQAGLADLVGFICGDYLPMWQREMINEYDITRHPAVKDVALHPARRAFMRLNYTREWRTSDSFWYHRSVETQPDRYRSSPHPMGCREIGGGWILQTGCGYRHPIVEGQ